MIRTVSETSTCGMIDNVPNRLSFAVEFFRDLGSTSFIKISSARLSAGLYQRQAMAIFNFIVYYYYFE